MPAYGRERCRSQLPRDIEMGSPMHHEIVESALAAILLPEKSQRLVMFGVRPLVQDLSLGGETVFLPDLLDMDQRELALAEENMLEARDRQKIVL